MILNQKVKWSVDQKHSGIHFKIRHLVIAHIKGSFKIFDANIYITNNDFTTAEIELWIDVDSLDTGNKERDDHLRGPDFFDAAHFPQMNFIAATIGKQNENGKRDMRGELTIKGVTRPIFLEVEFGGIIKDPWGREMSGFEVNGKLNRTDWGNIFKAPLVEGGFMMGEEVTISCEIELVNESTMELNAQKLAESAATHGR